MSIVEIKEFVGVVAPIAQILIAVGGIILIYVQLSKVNTTLRNDTQGRLFEQNGEFRRLLVEFPQYRKYFFDSQSIEKDSSDYPAVRTIAEMLANYMEHLAIQEPTLKKKDWGLWTAIIRDIYGTSPILQDLLSEKPNWYSKKLHTALAKNNMKST